MTKKVKKIIMFTLGGLLLVGSITSFTYAMGKYDLYEICNKSYKDLEGLNDLDLASDNCPGSNANLINLKSGEVASVPSSLDQMKAEQQDLLNKGVDSAAYQAEYNKMRSINQDYVGWLSIPGTAVNYPVCYDGNNDYYLHHDFYGNQSINGCLFVDRRCICPFYDKVTIVYGHHMRNGTMFGSLSKYTSYDYLAAHPIIKVAVSNRVLTYQIFSVFSEELCEQSYATHFSTLGDFVKQCNYLKSKSILPTGVSNFEINDRILVLSTCSYETDHSRFLVCAKLVK